MRGGLPAPRPSTPSCAPLACALQASPRPDHALTTGDSTPLLVPTTIRGQLQSAQPATQESVRPARAQARSPCIRADGPAVPGLRPAGATDVHPTTGRMHEHQIPEATIRPMAVARWSCSSRTRRCRQRFSTFITTMTPARASFCLHPHPAGSRSRVTPWPPLRRVHRSPDATIFRPILRGTRRRGLRKSGSAWRTRTWNHGKPAFLDGRLARSPGPIGRHAGTTLTRKGPAQAPPSSAASCPRCPGGSDSRRNAHRQLRHAPAVPARSPTDSAASSRWPRW
jgi:hypothetical protein